MSFNLVLFNPLLKIKEFSVYLNDIKLDINVLSEAFLYNQYCFYIITSYVVGIINYFHLSFNLIPISSLQTEAFHPHLSSLMYISIYRYLFSMGSKKRNVSKVECLPAAVRVFPICKGPLDPSQNEIRL